MRAGVRRRFVVFETKRRSLPCPFVSALALVETNWRGSLRSPACLRDPVRLPCGRRHGRLVVTISTTNRPCWFYVALTTTSHLNPHVSVSRTQTLKGESGCNRTLVMSRQGRDKTKVPLRLFVAWRAPVRLPCAGLRAPVRLRVGGGGAPPPPPGCRLVYRRICVRAVAVLVRWPALRFTRARSS